MPNAAIDVYLAWLQMPVRTPRVPTITATGSTSSSTGNAMAVLIEQLRSSTT